MIINSIARAKWERRDVRPLPHNFNETVSHITCFVTIYAFMIAETRVTEFVNLISVLDIVADLAVNDTG